MISPLYLIDENAVGFIFCKRKNKTLGALGVDRHVSMECIMSRTKYNALKNAFLLITIVVSHAKHI